LLRLSGGGVLKAKAYTTCVSVDKETFRLTKMNKNAPLIYAAYEQVFHAQSIEE